MRPEQRIRSKPVPYWLSTAATTAATAPMPATPLATPRVAKPTLAAQRASSKRSRQSRATGAAASFVANNSSRRPGRPCIPLTAAPAPVPAAPAATAAAPAAVAKPSQAEHAAAAALQDMAAAAPPPPHATAASCAPLAALANPVNSLAGNQQQAATPAWVSCSPFAGRIYECSAAGLVRNKSTLRIVSVITPTSSEPHKYIKLVLDNKRQKRLALRKVIAHCWLPESGFRLGADGYAVDGSLDVFYRDGSTDNCAAANLLVTGARQAQQQGLALTSRWGSRRDKVGRAAGASNGGMCTPPG